MAKQNTAPTMKDVAKEAGVSLGTVSKVINGIPVGDEYRKKVEQAIKTLDYHINAYAKGLKNNRTYTVAVILPNLLNPFFSMVAHYINRALVNRGYRMLLCDTEYDYTKEREMVQMVAQNKVDGIIALTYNPDLKIPPDVRSVSIDRYLSGSTTCVASDNYNGGRLAAQKLVENGCKNLAFLRIGSPLTSETNKRRDGFVAECEAMQLPCTQKILMDDAPLSEFEHFLEENLKDGRLAFDGIFCVTDKLAVAVMRRCVSKLFLPAPITTALAVFRSVKYIREGLSALWHGKLSVAVLDATAVTVSMARGDFATAGSVMFMLHLGEILEEWTHKKSVADLASAMSLRVDSVWQQVNGTEVLTKITDVKPGDRIVIRTGGMIPLDGRVVEGEAMVNQSSLTGESMPVAKHPGSPVYAGTVAEEGECVISVEKSSGSGRYDRVVRMIEESEKLKSTAEDKASRMADRLVPYTLGGTALTYLLTRNVTKMLSVLMVVFCLTRGADPVPGYTPPHDSDYYAQHLDELAQELNANVLPVLDETAHAEAGDGTVTVTASAKEYVPVRGAVLKFYDAALFTFEKAN